MMESFHDLIDARVSKVSEERIIVEEYLPSLIEGRTVTDYKFVCSFGKILCVIAGNAPDEPNCFCVDKWQAVYTVPGWHRLEAKYGWNNPLGSVEKPEKLSEMMEVARKLSSTFPLIRIDLYLTRDERGKTAVKVGELTPRMGGGWAAFDPVSYDLLLGTLASDPNKSDLKALIRRDSAVTMKWLDELQRSHDLMHGVVVPGFEGTSRIHLEYSVEAP
jgi:hypothetical protein